MDTSRNLIGQAAGTVRQAARQAAVLGQGGRQTIQFVGDASRAIFINPWTTAWEVVSHGSKQLFERAC